MKERTHMNFFKTVKEIKNKKGELHFKRFAIFESELFSIYIHTIHKADEDKHLHNHPWNMTTCVLFGSYEEEVKIGNVYWNSDGKVVVNDIWRGFRSYESYYDFHKIKKLISKKVVTIAFVGKRNNPNWGFLVEKNIIDSETYRKLKREGKFNE